MRILKICCLIESCRSRARRLRSSAATASLACCCNCARYSLMMLPCRRIKTFLAALPLSMEKKMLPLQEAEDGPSSLYLIRSYVQHKMQDAKKRGANLKQPPRSRYESNQPR